MMIEMDIFGGGGDVESGHYTYSATSEVLTLPFTPVRVVCNGFDSTTKAFAAYKDTVANKDFCYIGPTPYAQSFITINGNTVTIQGDLSSGIYGLDVWWTAYKE